MITIKILDKNYTFPETWNDIPLKKWVKIYPLIKAQKEASSEVDILIRIVSVLSDISYETLIDLEIESLGKVMELVEKLLQTEQEPGLEFEIDGVKYVFALKDGRKMTAAEYIDCDILLKDFEKNLHLLMAVLYRPEIDGKIEKYNSFKIYERGDLFLEKLSTNYVINASVFFSHIQTKYLLNFLEEKKKEIWKIVVERRKKIVKNLLHKDISGT